MNSVRPAPAGNIPSASQSPRQSGSASSAAIAVAGAIALAVAVGIGRFAFTPLLPMMLHDGTITLASGSWLATTNYIGYLLGAALCTVLPRSWPSALINRCGLAATIILTAAIALPVPSLWPWLRLLAGVASAVVFVQTSGWCLAHLADHGRPTWGATIFTGPGAGIALSGLVASILVSRSITAAMGWVVFGLLALVLSSLVWRIFTGPNMATPATVQPTVTEPEAMLSADAADIIEREMTSAERPARASVRAGVTKPATGGTVEMAVFTLAYGIAGFGYIITATFLPVIARAALPGSVWLDLFWPILGFGVVIGALIAARVPARFDPRLLLVACYLLQAIGVILTLVFANLAGFVAGSLLVGLPFTAISFFAMQDARRLRPHHAARFMGLLTAAYGIGQIVGPPLVSHLLRLSKDPAQGFAWSLTTASTALLIGAVLYLIMWLCWPINIRSSKA